MTLTSSTDTVHILVTLHGSTLEYVTALAANYASIRTHTHASLCFWIVYDETVPAESLTKLKAYIGEQDSVKMVDITKHPHMPISALSAPSDGTRQR